MSTLELCVGLLLHHVVGFAIPKGDRGIPTGVMQHEDMMATTQFSSPECLTLV